MGEAVWDNNAENKPVLIFIILTVLQVHIILLFPLGLFLPA